MISNRSKKLKVICSLVILVAIAVMPVGGISNPSAQAAEPPQLPVTPLNPDFLEFLENPRPESFYGKLPPPVDLSYLNDIPVEKVKALPQSLPSTFDWRTQGKVTPVKDQNPCGTCWAHGVLAAVESEVLIQESEPYNFSEQNLVCCTDPSWVYLTGNRCNAGGYSWLAADTLTKKGTRLEQCQPYNTDTINTEACDDSCTSIKRLTGYRLIADSPHMTAEVKNAIYNEGPVSMSYRMDEATYMHPGSVYYWPDCSYLTNHLVSIVGWDDTVAHPEGGGYGAWIVKNSWGTGWGDNGYFYLCYGSANMDDVVSYHYEDYDPNETLYYWDEAPMLGIGAGAEGADSLLGANVFTSEQNGSLSKVEFWTTSNNAQYEIYIYLDGDPADGFQNLATSQTGTCQEMGYYSIPLDSPVPLTNGQPFTVAVKMTTPGWEYPMPVEVDEFSGMCTPPIQLGVSFAREDGEEWTDVGLLGGNLCLRAVVTSGAVAETIHVDDDFADDPANHQWDTIQEGIADANDGDIIIVHPGTYNGFTIESKNDLSIIGQDGVTVNNANMFVDGVEWWAMAYVRDSANINIEGIVFDGSEIAVNMLEGIAYGDSTGSITGVTVRNITSSEWALGVCIWGDEEGSTAVDISQLTVENCGMGIMVGNAETNLDGCSITGMAPNGGYGIEVMDNAQVTMESCVVCDCWKEEPEPGEAGLGIMIGLAQEYEAIYGIADERPCTVEMTGSTLCDSNCGVAVYDDGNLTAHFNNIAGNDLSGVHNAAIEEVDATNNWWGDASGPYNESTNPDGKGDGVSDNVDYSPWLNAEITPAAIGLDPIKTDLLMAYGYKAGEGVDGWTAYDPDWTVTHPDWNTLTILFAGRGYLLNANKSCHLTYGSNTYELDAGWNLIGWLGW